MSKALTVIAECVDSRSGKRYKANEVFDPAPTKEQAERLFKAGCLPREAIAAGEKADAALEKKSKEDVENRKKAAGIAEAQRKIDAAIADIETARTLVSEATEKDEAAKKQAADFLTAAEKRKADAENELANVSK